MRWPKSAATVSRRDQAALEEAPADDPLERFRTLAGLSALAMRNRRISRSSPAVAFSIMTRSADVSRDNNELIA